MQKVMSGSFLIAGTTIGGGMLAIPLLTAKMGFFPALILMFLVWFVMFLSGLFVAQAVLWIPKKINFLHLAHFYLGKGGQWLTGILFLFLYGCLVVAYFSGLGPLVNELLQKVFHTNSSPILIACILALFFGGVVAFGMKLIDRVNAILFWGLIFSFVALLGFAFGHVKTDLLLRSNYLAFFGALPLLFTSFGYHNILPSLSYYLDRDAKQIQSSIFFGSLLALIIYALWQLAMLGVIDGATLEQFAQKNIPPTLALQMVLQSPWIGNVALFFSFFAITTSLLGVSFSLVDFLADGLNWHTTGRPRYVLTFFVFALPLLFAFINPYIFSSALRIAGAYGESILNGILPAMFFYSGKKWMNKQSQIVSRFWPFYISLVIAISFVAIGFEIFGN